VDVDPLTFNITPDNVRLLLEEKGDPSEYAVIMPVHLMGYPVEMDEMNRIAEQYDLLTFEDAAQAHGTLYKGKTAGALSKVSAFSFYIAHNIQAGEMGAVLTDDPEINRLVRKIKTQGRMCDCPVCTRSSGACPQLEEHSEDGDFDPRFVHDLIGHNFKAMEFQAALAVTQIEKADWIIKKRRSNVKYLNRGLEPWESILQLPRYSDEIGYLAYPLVIKDPELISRKRLRRRLEEEGVETRPLFGCIPTQQPAYSHLRSEYEGKLPNAEYLGLNAFYIGCHQYLEEDDLDYVVGVFGRVLSEI
jgi:dTDP-4-amino-4,6-dideoxygalactose transaminase